MYCENCGKYLNDGTEYCDECYERQPLVKRRKKVIFDFLKNSKVLNYVEPDYNNPSYTEVEIKDNKSYVITLSVIAASLLLAIVVFFKVGLFSSDIQWGDSRKDVKKVMEKIKAEEIEKNQAHNYYYKINNKKYKDMYVKFEIDDEGLYTVHISGNEKDLEKLMKNKYGNKKSSKQSFKRWEKENSYAVLDKENIQINKIDENSECTVVIINKKMNETYYKQMKQVVE